MTSERRSDRCAAIGVIFSIIGLAIYRELQPFHLQSNNILALGSQYTVLLTFGCGA